MDHGGSRSRYQAAHSPAISRRHISPLSTVTASARDAVNRSYCYRTTPTTPVPVAMPDAVLIPPAIRDRQHVNALNGVFDICRKDTHRMERLSLNLAIRVRPYLEARCDPHPRKVVRADPPC